MKTNMPAATQLSQCPRNRGLAGLTTYQGNVLSPGSYPGSFFKNSAYATEYRVPLAASGAMSNIRLFPSGVS